MTALIAVTSGTPRVGRSTLSANLAHFLNESGHRTGWLGVGGSAPPWNIQPIGAWSRIIDGGTPLKASIHKDQFGVDLLATRGGDQTPGSLSNEAVEQMSDAIRSLDTYTYLILDMAAGMSTPAIAGCLAATETLLVITPDTPTLTAAYEWLTQLCRHGFAGPVNLVMNQVDKPALAQTIFTRFRDLAQKKLNIQTNLWGTMSEEMDIKQAGNHDRPLSLALPQAKLVSDIAMIGDRLVAEQPPENQTQPLDMIWRHFIHRLRTLPEMPQPHVQQAASTQKKETTDPPAEPTPSQAAILPSFDPSGALHHLTEQLSAIANELSGIRRLLETRTPEIHTKAQHETARDPDGVKLDFDAFIASRQKSI